jgi:DNA invertase Pin-like site-specific DNA recombinase
LKAYRKKIDTSTPTGRLIFHVFGAIAEFERDLIRERTMAGLEAARARGRKGGRKPKLSSTQVDALNKLYRSKSYTIAELCTMFSISRRTHYRVIDRKIKKK